MAGHPAIALIDSGSTHNFMSCSWIRKYQVPMASVDVAENLSVTLANGATQSQPLQETISLEMALGEYRCCAQFISFPLSRYDIILGKPWLFQNNPSINFKTNEISLGSSQLTLTARTLMLNFL